MSRHRPVLVNAGSLIAAAAVTALLGAAFWWLAARQFSQASVGIAAGAVSAMTLLGFVATIGLGTVLMGELPRRRDKAHELINAALLAAAGAGALLGLAFAVLAPLLSSGFDPLGQSWLSVLIFAAGVALTALTLVLDQALIGLLRGGLQLVRNIVFASVKLVLLAAVVALSAAYAGMGIYAAWALGALVSLAVLAPFYRGHDGARRLSFGLLRDLRGDAASHHAFNLALRAPDLLLPIVVLMLLTPELNASFFVAWMIASLLFGVPQSLSTVLYAVGSGDPIALPSRFRFSLAVSVGFGAAAVLALLVAGGAILGVFGDAYADDATVAIQILAIGVFPETVRTHFVAVRRLGRRVGSALPLVWGGAALEVAGGAAGALLAGDLTGVAAGWLAAICIESSLMGRDVWAMVSAAGPGSRRVSRPSVARSPAP
ncbi:MAG TPA: oligosaccharide flippase family protein [Solirubrobacterales bacterium]|nr:oligosaccharide flippase family protein [Solirubrobacterales bacterium]